MWYDIMSEIDVKNAPSSNPNPEPADNDDDDSHSGIREDGRRGRITKATLGG